MAELIVVTGGARSGKSAEAMRLAQPFERRVFIATAEGFDDEMRERIERHRRERGDRWQTVEAPLDLAGAILAVAEPGAAVVVDCLTVWLGNLMHRDPSTTEGSPPCLEMLAALRRARAARVILVTNEIGMGIVPEDSLSRHFRDVAGRLNQDVAAIADRLILMVCGRPLTIGKAGVGQGEDPDD